MLKSVLPPGRGRRRSHQRARTAVGAANDLAILALPGYGTGTFCSDVSYSALIAPMSTFAISAYPRLDGWTPSNEKHGPNGDVVALAARFGTTVAQPFPLHVTMIGLTSWYTKPSSFALVCRY